MAEYFHIILVLQTKHFASFHSFPRACHGTISIFNWADCHGCKTIYCPPLNQGWLQVQTGNLERREKSIPCVFQIAEQSLSEVKLLKGQSSWRGKILLWLWGGHGAHTQSLSIQGPCGNSTHSRAVKAEERRAWCPCGPMIVYSRRMET